MTDGTGEQYGPGDITPADDQFTHNPDGTITVHRIGENVTITPEGGDDEESAADIDKPDAVDLDANEDHPTTR